MSSWLAGSGSCKNASKELISAQGNNLDVDEEVHGKEQNLKERELA
jgi:hypothetical protein